jgi:hypothetical protein
MPDKSYKIGAETFDIPEAEIGEFLKDNPNAEEVKSFVIDKDTFDIPLAEVDAFVKEMPQAKELKKKDITETTTTEQEGISPDLSAQQIDGSAKVNPKIANGDFLRSIAGLPIIGDIAKEKLKSPLDSSMSESGSTKLESVAPTDDKAPTGYEVTVRDIGTGGYGDTDMESLRRFEAKKGLSEAEIELNKMSDVLTDKGYTRQFDDTKRDFADAEFKMQSFQQKSDELNTILNNPVAPLLQKQAAEAELMQLQNDPEVQRTTEKLQGYYDQYNSLRASVEEKAKEVEGYNEKNASYLEGAQKSFFGEGLPSVLDGIEGTLKFVADFTGYTALTGKMGIEPPKFIFGDMAKGLREGTADWDQAPEGVVGEVVSGMAAMGPMMIQTVFLPESKFTFPTLMAQEAFGNEYLKSESSIKAAEEGVKNFALGAAFHGLGVVGGKTGNLVGKLTEQTIGKTASGILDKSTAALVMSTGFGSQAAMSEYLQTGQWNWRTFNVGAGTGIGFAIPTFFKAAHNKAVTDFVTASPEAIKQMSELPRSASELADKSIELMEKAPDFKEGNEKIQAVMASQSLRKIANIKTITQRIVENPEYATSLKLDIKNAENLTPEQKQEAIDKIDIVRVQNNPNAVEIAEANKQIALLQEGIKLNNESKTLTEADRKAYNDASEAKIKENQNKINALINKPKIETDVKEEIKVEAEGEKADVLKADAETEARVAEIEKRKSDELDKANFSIEELKTKGYDVGEFTKAQEDLLDYMKTSEALKRGTKDAKYLELENAKEEVWLKVINEGNEWAKKEINKRYEDELSKAKQKAGGKETVDASKMTPEETAEYERIKKRAEAGGVSVEKELQDLIDFQKEHKRNFPSEENTAFRDKNIAEYQGILDKIKPKQTPKAKVKLAMVRPINELKAEVELMKGGKRSPETDAKIAEFEREIASQEKAGINPDKGRTQEVSEVETEGGAGEGVIGDIYKYPEPKAKDKFKLVEIDSEKGVYIFEDMQTGKEHRVSDNVFNDMKNIKTGKAKWEFEPEEASVEETANPVVKFEGKDYEVTSVLEQKNGDNKYELTDKKGKSFWTNELALEKNNTADVIKSVRETVLKREKADDTKNKQGVSGKKLKGKKPVEEKPIVSTGKEKAEAGGVLEKQKQGEVGKPLDLKELSKTVKAEDLSRFQELSNSLAEGELLLKDNVDASGKKLTPEKRQAIEKSVQSTKDKITALAKVAAEPITNPILEGEQSEKVKKKATKSQTQLDANRLLSKEVFSVEEGVAQYFLGKGRIRTEDLKSELGIDPKKDISEFRGKIWAHKKDAPTFDVIASRIAEKMGREVDGEFEQEVRNAIIDAVRDNRGRGDIMDFLLAKERKENLGEYADYTDAELQELAELRNEKEKLANEIASGVDGKEAELIIEADYDGIDKDILSLSEAELDAEYKESEKYFDEEGNVDYNLIPKEGETGIDKTTEATESAKIPDGKTSEATDVQETIRAKEIKSQLDKKSDELSAARTTLKNKRAELDKGIIEDQPDLFGERKSEQEPQLFTERADASQRAKITDPLEANVKKLESEVEALETELAKEEGKKDTTLFEEPAAETDIEAEAMKPMAETLYQLEQMKKRGEVSTAEYNAEKRRLREEIVKKEKAAKQQRGDSEQGQTQKKYEDIAGLTPKQQPGRISVDPIIGGKAKPIKDILFDVSRAIKQKTLYSKPGARRGAIGVYMPGNNAVKIKFAGDIDTTAHEFGHSIDDLFGVLSDLRTNPNLAVEAELAKFSPFGSKPPQGHPDPGMYRRAEGFAEFLRAMIVNPAAAKNSAPELHTLYESKVSPEYRKALEDFSNDVRAWAGSSGRDITLSNIELKPEKPKGIVQEILSKKNSDDQFTITWADKVAANYTNPLRAFDKAFEQAVELKGEKDVLPENDPRILSRLLLGVDGKYGEILQSGMIDGRGNILKDANGNPKNLKWLIEPLNNTDMTTIERDMNDVVAYMVSERAVELSNREEFAGKKVLTGVGGGIFKDIDVAKKTLEEFETGDPDRLARVKEAAQRYREFSDGILRYMVESGRMSAFDYQKISANNLQYVAMQRVMEAEPNMEIDSSFGESGGLGSKSQPINKIKGSSKQIINPYISLVDTLYKAVRESDRNNVLRAFRDMVFNQRGMYEGDPKKLGEIGVKGQAGDKNAITIFVDGKPEHWIFQKDIYEGLKGLDSEGYKIPAIVTALPQLLRWSVTNFPTFAVRNVVRDTQDRLIKSEDRSGFRDLVGDKEHWKELARTGGLNSGYYLRDRASYNGLLEVAMGELAKNKNTIILDPRRLKAGWESYQALLRKSETVNRVAEYRAAFREAKKKGMDNYNASLYAGFKSRDLMDFALMGHHMKLVNQLVPFSNAAIQGTRKAVSSARKNPTRFAANMFIYSVVPSMALWLLNHKDEETAKEYENLPAYQRDMAHNFKIGPNLWLSIPKPYELSLPAAGVDRALSKAIYGNDEAFKGYGGTVTKSLFPLDEGNIAGPGQGILESITNYDFFREKTIVPPYENALDLSLRNTENSSRLGKMLQEMMGVDARKIDHFIKSQTSYFGNAALKISDIGADRGPKFGMSDLGFFRETPAYNSPKVQELLQYAKTWGLSTSSTMKEFGRVAKEYFNAKTNKEKDEMAAILVDFADKTLTEWKAKNMDEQRQEKRQKKIERASKKAERMERRRTR